MKPSPELTAYNLGVARAVKTYRADRTAAQGLCVLCERRRRKGPNRVCQACLNFRAAQAKEKKAT